jgi:hypothetical protein
LKVLIAVISYYGDALNGAHQAIRDTWGKDLSDLRFFMPRLARYTPQRDEVFLDVLHDYDCISHEVREIMRWSIREGYDFTFFCCNDLYIIPKKLFACGFEQYDYAGVFYPSDVPIGKTFTFNWNGKPIENMTPWAAGGWGWFLSKKASERVVAVETNWASAGDIYVGHALSPAILNGEIVAKEIVLNNGICWHYRHDTNKTYNPATGWMQQMYKEHQ